MDVKELLESKKGHGPFRKFGIFINITIYNVKCASRKMWLDPVVNSLNYMEVQNLMMVHIAQQTGQIHLVETQQQF